MFDRTTGTPPVHSEPDMNGSDDSDDQERLRPGATTRDGEGRRRRDQPRPGSTRRSRAAVAAAETSELEAFWNTLVAALDGLDGELSLSPQSSDLSRLVGLAAAEIARQRSE